MTSGVAALGQARSNVSSKPFPYTMISHENDPYEEHDFGALEAEGVRIFIKIDYFDKTLQHHSPDPSNSNVTERGSDLLRVARCIKFLNAPKRNK